MDRHFTSEKSLTKQMGLLFSGRMLGLAFTFMIPLVLVRAFSQEDFGLYKQLFLLHGTLLIIVSCGVPYSLYYFLPRHADDRNAYVSQTLVMLTALGGLAFVGLLLLKGSLSIWLNNPKLEPLIPYMGIVTALMLVSSILEIVMITASQAKLAAMTILMSEFTKAWLVIGAAVATQSMFVLVLAMMSLGLIRIAALVVYLKRERVLTIGALNRGYLYAQLAYALPAGAAVIVQNLPFVATQFYVASSYDPAIFAVFAVGCFNLPLVSLLFNSVGEVTLVKITEQVQAGALDQLIHVVSDSIRKLCVVFVPLFVFLLTVAREFIVGLYTSKFEASVPIFLIFIFTIPLTAVSLDYVLRAFADTRFLLKMHTVGAGVTVILLLLLTKPLGLLGAALATTLGLAITRSYGLIRVKQLARTTLKKIVPWRTLGKILGYSVIPAVIILVVKRFVELPVLMVLFGSLIIFVVTYLGLIWNSGLVNDEEKGMLTYYIQRGRAVAGGFLVSEGRKFP